MSGLAMGAATLPVVPLESLVAELTWVVAVGGFAMLPDLDTGGVTARRGFPRLHGSTVALMWGPLTSLLAELLGRLFGGHRNGSHSILGIAGTAVVTGALSSTYAGRLFLLALAIGLALEALAFAIPGTLEELWPVNLLVSFGAAWWLLGVPGAADDRFPQWLTAAVLVGSATHVIGDMLTVGGIPPLWPVSRTRVSLRLFRTGSVWERRLVAPGLLIGACWLVLARTGLDADPVLSVLAR
jgi:membrane-bound metal-dependent hydrolase YbcI (DUF457 family)